MTRFIISLLAMLALTGCNFIQKPEIEQGNIYTPAMVSQLHNGMSETEVREIMGNPMLVNIFTPGRIEYVYTYQTGNEKRTQKRVSLSFAGGRLVAIRDNG